MSVNILAIGDVFGENGLDFLSKKLRAFKKLKNIAFTVVNGENASVVGITPVQADAIFDAGADVITLGNHTFSRQNIIPYLDDNRYILRPDNLSPLSSGTGHRVYDAPFGEVLVINLIGRVGMDLQSENPFFRADKLIKENPARIVLVDMHAEATSEKAALAWYLDGRVSAVWGTHTHVQTSDAAVLPHGTGFITDLGMTGPALSILGVKPEQSISRFLGEPRRQQYMPASGARKMEGAIFEIDEKTGKCLSVEAVRITE
ncbi:MAG: YmdB family metallophosphoesterase [Oscillospiraceae bacterium]|nr:YmdB family metallophosphoesterase [Oscillospiraceae bacterium]